MLRCTPLVLPDDTPVLRQSVRPLELRPPGYDAQFDATTLFYDVIAVDASHGTSLVFVGPPLLNLLPSFHGGSLNGRPLASTRTCYYLRHRCSDVWIPDWTGEPGEHIQVEVEGCLFAATPQPSANPLYAGRRVLYTLSKDNEIAWVVDWMRFHMANHGADAALIYDNASTRYAAGDLEAALRDAFPTAVVHVVEWPYKYGPQGISEQSGWDSDFCQAAAFQDARFRFLANASSVLNCDIDELVVSDRGESIFAATEASASGYVMFGGAWVPNVAADDRSRTVPDAPVRHSSFVHVERTQPHGCPTKWCVVPGRCSLADQWITHVVRGKDDPSCYSRSYSYRHFRGISTNWKYQRTWPTAFDARLHRVDTALELSFVRAGMRRRAHDAPDLWARFRRHLSRPARRLPARGERS